VDNPHTGTKIENTGIFSVAFVVVRSIDIGWPFQLVQWFTNTHVLELWLWCSGEWLRSFAFGSDGQEDVTKYDGTTGYLLFPGSDHVETVAIVQQKQHVTFQLSYNEAICGPNVCTRNFCKMRHGLSFAAPKMNIR
jgi:hypothetical protein